MHFGGRTELIRSDHEEVADHATTSNTVDHCLRFVPPLFMGYFLEFSGCNCLLEIVDFSRQTTESQIDKTNHFHVDL